MATAKNPNRVAVLRLHTGEILTIRANPSAAAVKRFVEEHNRRYEAKEAGGPDGHPARLVLEGYFFDEEIPSEKYDFEAGTPIKLPTVNWPPSAA